MADEYQTTILNSKEYMRNSRFAALNDEQLSVAVRDFTEEAIAAKHENYDFSDVAAATNRIYPIISNIVFNSNFGEVRRDCKLCHKIIAFLVKNLL